MKKLLFLALLFSVPAFAMHQKRKQSIQQWLFAAIEAGDRRAAENAFYTALYYKITIDQFCLNGISPLHAAVRSRHRGLVKFFLDKEASVNESSDEGETPLHRVARHAVDPISTDLAELLIDRGANINARNSSGNTPLHRAVLVGDTSVVKLLMKRGADRYARNNNGQTAFDLVINDKAMRRLLVSWDHFMATQEVLNAHDQARTHELLLMKDVNSTQEPITVDPYDIADIVSVGTATASMSTTPVVEWDLEHEEIDNITID